MAERTAVSPHARPIVADPEASLSHRPYRVRHPRLWPLWSLCILLLLALSALAALGWWQSQQLGEQLERLRGELSNVHARLDGEQVGKQQQDDEVSRLAARFDRFESAQGRRGEDVEARLASLSEALESVEARIAQQAGSAAQDESMAEALDSRLSALQASLDALEQTGKEGREALTDRQDALTERQQGQQQALSLLGERLEALDDVPERQAAIETRLESMEARLADLFADDGAAAQQLAELAREIKEIRQSQLVINARLEGMAP
ncbi:MAG TPA: hypothetical protein VK991_14255 [Halomonas sp.]|nr:hypothetical protein [Halomonas sp.]